MEQRKAWLDANNLVPGTLKWHRQNPTAPMRLMGGPEWVRPLFEQGVFTFEDYLKLIRDEGNIRNESDSFRGLTASGYIYMVEPGRVPSDMQAQFRTPAQRQAEALRRKAAPKAAPQAAGSRASGSRD